MSDWWRPSWTAPPRQKKSVRSTATSFPLNERLQRACTHWQLRPTSGDRPAVNDHTDPGWDGAVLDELATIEQRLLPLTERASGASPLASVATTSDSPPRAGSPPPEMAAGSTGRTSAPAIGLVRTPRGSRRHARH